MMAKLISFCEDFQRERRASYWNRTVAELSAMHFTPLFPRWVALRAREKERDRRWYRFVEMNTALGRRRDCCPLNAYCLPLHINFIDCS